MSQSRRLRYVLCCIPRALYSTYSSITTGSLDAPSVISSSWKPKMERNSRPGAGLAASTGWFGSVARFYQKSYAADYLGLAFMFAGYMVTEYFVTPFHRMIFINNINIQYPHALVERVPTEMNIVYCGAVPAVILIVWLAIARANFHKFHVTILGLAISLIMTSLLTNIIKNAVGRPRPDLISRCKPAVDTPPNTLVTISVCTETDKHRLQDGWRSFPSGHSSFAFAGLGFLSLFLCGQLHVFRPHTDISRAIFGFIPLVCAALIAISRCEDYRHDVYDVTCGSILGFAIAYFSYRRYYPRLRSSGCHEPFISREEKFREGFGKLRNDEESMLPRRREFDLEDMHDDHEDHDDNV
ncbi:phosphatidic acid phosphatase type 2/haloperoxidase [Xylogone sp. PMI_703]|nr:phosphatidic acid phosphatase type 2/haloperoxidase [Xylogone sp. PMI_703]